MGLDHRIEVKNAAEFYTEQDDVFGRIANRYDCCAIFSASESIASGSEGSRRSLSGNPTGN